MSDTTPDPPPARLLQDGIHLLRGMLMGGADVIPGVSGGTMALIVGIYERLVAAISHVDRTLWKHLRKGEWRTAAEHLDLRFLIALGMGIGLGILAIGSLVNGLLAGAQTRPLTLAAFFGMIVASTILVAQMIQVRSRADIAITCAFGLLGAVVAYGITTIPTTAVDPSYGYLFLCGVVAICAMILPGISGAYILLILGAYVYLTDILKAAPHGNVTLHKLSAVAVFATGCVIGLLSFSKLLRWLLAHHHAKTMATLCGFMIGAIRKIWPFQEDLTPGIEQLKTKAFRNVWPESIDSHVLTVLAIALIAMTLVLALNHLCRPTAK